MEREDAIRKLKELEGKDLVALASRYDVMLLFGKATKRIRVGQGILSSGCHSGIRRTLELAGHEVDFPGPHRRDDPRLTGRAP